VSFGCLARRARQSNLMKFVDDHPTTKQILYRWSAPEDTAVVAHYFGGAGTLTQQPWLCLLQTLLFGILSSVPSLILIICRDRWAKLQMGSARRHRWSWPRLGLFRQGLFLWKPGVLCPAAMRGTQQMATRRADLVVSWRHQLGLGGRSVLSASSNDGFQPFRTSDSYGANDHGDNAERGHCQHKLSNHLVNSLMNCLVTCSPNNARILQNIGHLEARVEASGQGFGDIRREIAEKVVGKVLTGICRHALRKARKEREEPPDEHSRTQLRVFN
jgi:hypothetical protein